MGLSSWSLSVRDSCFSPTQQWIQRLTSQPAKLGTETMLGMWNSPSQRQQALHILGTTPLRGLTYAN
jgi:hypothetical protein